MKKLIFITSLIAIVTSSWAQIPTNNKLPVDSGLVRRGASAQSVSSSMTERGFNLVYLFDGRDDFAALSYTIAPISGTNGRLRLQALGAFSPNNPEDRAYLTLGLAYNVFNTASGFRLDLFAGPKGINVQDNFRWTSGRNSMVYGVGFTIPIGN